MYQLTFNELSQSEFLQQYWQKKPLLIKQGFKNFSDPISPEELAGLAVEECIESRIITNNNNQWQAHHGPFEDFSLLTESHSTLLVQAVDHWHADSEMLLAPFRFIPNWRIDDLMISYSTPKGGVGPHLDQYDVFIIQGQGKRHWRVGMPSSRLQEVVPCKDLLQITQFDACIDAVLEPGDILYIPPGCPHEGYAVENAINYSVGFRAPNQVELLSSFCDYLIDGELGTIRYSDPELGLRDNSGELQLGEIEKIKTLMSNALNCPATFSRWLGENLSQAKHETQIEPLEDPYTEQEVKNLLLDDMTFMRSGGVRILYQKMDGCLLLSIDGENIELPIDSITWVPLFSDFTSVTSDQLKSSINCSHLIKTMSTLINEGYWYIE